MTRSLPNSLGDNEARVLSALLVRYADLPLSIRAQALAAIAGAVAAQDTGPSVTAAKAEVILIGDLEADEVAS